jgi:hypothetical protein
MMMERPVDWSPVGWASDPTPGDPVVVRTGGQQFQGIAAKLTRTAATLRAMAAGATYGSQSVAALLENRDELLGQIETAATRYQTAGDSLVDYSYALDRVRATTSQALARAKSAQWDMDENTRLAKLYDRLADQADTPDQADQRTRYLRLQSARWDDVTDAQTRIGTEQQVVAQAVVERDQAAQASSDRIEQITSNDGLNDSWWDNWGAKVVAWLADVTEVIASIVGVLALVLCWVPVLGQALMAVAAIAGVVAAVANIALAATGERTWGEAILSIVFAALGCVGLGGVKGILGALKGGVGLAKGAGLARVFGEGGTILANGLRAVKGLSHFVGALWAKITGSTLSGRTVWGNLVGDRAFKYISRLKPEDGFFDVVSHGTPESLIKKNPWTDEIEEVLTAEHLAARITASPSWGGQAIRLIACETGQEGGTLAQTLADILKVDVKAPTGDVWITKNGDVATDIGDMWRVVKGAE